MNLGYCEALFRMFLVFLEDSFLASLKYLGRLLRLRISEFVMLCASVHRCICVGLKGGWLSTSVGKTSVAILEDIYGFLFIGWN